MIADKSELSAFWSLDPQDLARRLSTTGYGLTKAEAGRRLVRFGQNRVADGEAATAPRLLLRQFGNPLVLILIFGAALSLSLREWVDASVILAVVFGSALLGFVQEFRASAAIAKLRARLALQVRACRDGRQVSVPATDIVPGDVISLNAGDLIPADCLLLEAVDFLVVEASLTGESFPVEKRPGRCAATAGLAERTNAVFLGSSVRSGTARALVVATGLRTVFGEIASRLQAREAETEFARGLRRFGVLLMRVMVAIVVFVLVINILIGRPVDQSLLFAVALAVGLSPELLPAIVSVTLAAGAKKLASRGVLVRRLEAIESFGGMDVLCTDKTGTLTTGAIVLDASVDVGGQHSDTVARLGFLNADLETGIDNPLDAAIRGAGARRGLASSDVRKIDEIPYDFARRRLTIVIEQDGARQMITKGAFENVAAICPTILRDGAEEPLDAVAMISLEAFVRLQGERGARVLAVAQRRVEQKPDYVLDHERGMVFAGFLVFVDPPRPDAAATLAALEGLGIAVKVVTGDNRYVAAHVAQAVGLDPSALLTGGEVRDMTDEALWHRAARADVFAEIDPQQKERIVRALQRTGLSVGYLGDGINDAPALRAADIGISVETAVDVARESADVVLLRPDLDVLRLGVEEGRSTFVNTLKYIHITTSANFGNMVSMAVATPFLPFLPLLPKQILLNNFISDLPSILIATDNVDPERVAQPVEWDLGRLQTFMVVFGLVSSAFDLLTFALLLWVFQADQRVFQTGWFIVSLLTELMVVLILRTQRPSFQSRPGRLLLLATIVVAVATLTIPFLGVFGDLFEFVALSAGQVAILLGIVASYVLATEAAKFWLVRR